MHYSYVTPSFFFFLALIRKWGEFFSQTTFYCSCNFPRAIDGVFPGSLFRFRDIRIEDESSSNACVCVCVCRRGPRLPSSRKIPQEPSQSLLNKFQSQRQITWCWNPLWSGDDGWRLIGSSHSKLVSFFTFSPGNVPGIKGLGPRAAGPFSIP